MAAPLERKLPLPGSTKEKRRSLLPSPLTVRKAASRKASSPEANDGMHADRDTSQRVNNNQQQQQMPVSPPPPQFTIGQRICIAGIKPGIVRYFGQTKFADGDWCGIELDENDGKHNGTVEGHTYFECEPGYGIFAPCQKVDALVVEKVSKLQQPKASGLKRLSKSRSRSPDSISLKESRSSKDPFDFLTSSESLSAPQSPRFVSKLMKPKTKGLTSSQSDSESLEGKASKLPKQSSALPIRRSQSALEPSDVNKYNNTPKNTAKKEAARNSKQYTEVYSLSELARLDSKSVSRSERQVKARSLSHDLSEIDSQLPFSLGLYAKQKEAVHRSSNSSLCSQSSSKSSITSPCHDVLTKKNPAHFGGEAMSETEDETDMLGESNRSNASSLGILTDNMLLDNSLITSELLSCKEVGKKEYMQRQRDKTDSKETTEMMEKELDQEISGISTPDMSSSTISGKDLCSSPDMDEARSLETQNLSAEGGDSTLVTGEHTPTPATTSSESSPESDISKFNAKPQQAIIAQRLNNRPSHDSSVNSVPDEGRTGSKRNSLIDEQQYPLVMRTSVDLNERDSSSVSASVEIAKTAVQQYAELMAAAEKERQASARHREHKAARRAARRSSACSERAQSCDSDSDGDYALRRSASSGAVDYTQSERTQLISDLEAGHAKQERPVSMISTGSADTGIVADLNSLQGSQLKKERPLSLVSTTSIDTGYQPDVESDVGTLTTNSPLGDESPIGQVTDELSPRSAALSLDAAYQDTILMFKKAGQKGGGNMRPSELASDLGIYSSNSCRLTTDPEADHQAQDLEDQMIDQDVMGDQDLLAFGLGQMLDAMPGACSGAGIRRGSPSGLELPSPDDEPGSSTEEEDMALHEGIQTPLSDIHAPMETIPEQDTPESPDMDLVTSLQLTPFDMDNTEESSSNSLAANHTASDSPEAPIEGYPEKGTTESNDDSNIKPHEVTKVSPKDEMSKSYKEKSDMERSQLESETTTMYDSLDDINKVSDLPLDKLTISGHGTDVAESIEDGGSTICDSGYMDEKINLDEVRLHFSPNMELAMSPPKHESMLKPGTLEHMTDENNTFTDSGYLDESKMNINMNMNIDDISLLSMDTPEQDITNVCESESTETDLKTENNQIQDQQTEHLENILQNTENKETKTIDSKSENTDYSTIDSSSIISLERDRLTSIKSEIELAEATSNQVSSTMSSINNNTKSEQDFQSDTSFLDSINLVHDSALREDNSLNRNVDEESLQDISQTVSTHEASEDISAETINQNQAIECSTLPAQEISIKPLIEGNKDEDLINTKQIEAVSNEVDYANRSDTSKPDHADASKIESFIDNEIIEKNEAELHATAEVKPLNSCGDGIIKFEDLDDSNEHEVTKEQVILETLSRDSVQGLPPPPSVGSTASNTPDSEINQNLPTVWTESSPPEVAVTLVDEKAEEEASVGDMICIRDAIPADAIGASVDLTELAVEELIIPAGASLVSSSVPQFISTEEHIIHEDIEVKPDVSAETNDDTDPVASTFNNQEITEKEKASVDEDKDILKETVDDIPLETLAAVPSLLMECVEPEGNSVENHIEYVTEHEVLVETLDVTEGPILRTSTPISEVVESQQSISDDQETTATEIDPESNYSETFSANTTMNESESLPLIEIEIVSGSEMSESTVKDIGQEKGPKEKEKEDEKEVDEKKIVKKNGTKLTKSKKIEDVAKADQKKMLSKTRTTLKDTKSKVTTMGKTVTKDNSALKNKATKPNTTKAPVIKKTELDKKPTTTKVGSRLSGSYNKETPKPKIKEDNTAVVNNVKMAKNNNNLKKVDSGVGGERKNPVGPQRRNPAPKSKWGNIMSQIDSSKSNKTDTGSTKTKVESKTTTPRLNTSTSSTTSNKLRTSQSSVGSSATTQRSSVNLARTSAGTGQLTTRSPNRAATTPRRPSSANAAETKARSSLSSSTAVGRPVSTSNVQSRTKQTNDQLTNSSDASLSTSRNSNSTGSRPTSATKAVNRKTAALRRERSPSVGSEASGSSQGSSYGSRSPRTKEATPEPARPKTSAITNRRSLAEATSTRPGTSTDKADLRRSSISSRLTPKKEGSPSSVTEKKISTTRDTTKETDQNRNKTTKSPDTTASSTTSTKRASNQPDVVTQVVPPGAAAEIGRLEALCETRTKQLNVARIQLRTSAQGFDAMTVLVKYLTDELDAFSCPEVTAKLKTVKGQLADAQQQIDLLAKEKATMEKSLGDLKVQHAARLKKSNDAHQLALQQLQQRLTAEKDADVEKVAEQYSTEVTTLKTFLEKNISDMKSKHEKTLAEHEELRDKAAEKYKEDYEERCKELTKQHERRLEEITRTFENIKVTLSEKVETLCGECEEMRSREANLEARTQRESDMKIHIALMRYKHLPAEIESLKAVMEMRNQELHELRRRKRELEKEVEEVPVARKKIITLQQNVENLEALIQLKADYEKQLAEKHQLLLRKFDKEYKANKRLSMDNEELAWRLSNSAESPDLLRRSISHSPTRPTPPEPLTEVVRRRKSPACSIPTSPRNQTEFDRSPVTLQSPPKNSGLKRSGTYELLNKEMEDKEKDMKQSDV